MKDDDLTFFIFYIFLYDGIMLTNDLFLEIMVISVSIWRAQKHTHIQPFDSFRFIKFLTSVWK